MSIITALLLPIIVISHLAAQWYLFRFIGYHTLSLIRGPRRGADHGSQRKPPRISPLVAFRRWLVWGACLALLLLVLASLVQVA